MTSDILTLIQNGMSHFSKGQKLIANYIINSYDKAAFMTASKLGKTVNVSESTVVRFAAELGYDGYPSMQRSLQKMIRNRLTSVQRIEVANDRMGDQDVLDMVLQSDIDKIRLTLEEIDRESFDKAADAIVAARRIYIVGLRSSASIATFLGFYFNLIFDNVVMISANTVSEVLESLLRVGEGDVVIGISFPRYSKDTINAARFARSRGAEIIAITDQKQSPVAQLSSAALLAPSEMLSFIDSMTAPMSLINALLVGIATKMGTDVTKTFTTLERLWDQYDVFGGADDE